MTDKEKLEHDIKMARVSIESHQNIIRDAKAKLAELKKSETTYSLGDRFRDERGKKWLMVYQGIDNHTPTATLSSLENGIRHHRRRIVQSASHITQEEFEAICDGDKFTRYWDFRRKILSELYF